MKKYKLLIQIGYQRFEHKETADSEYNSRNKTIDLAMSKFGVSREDVKIIECNLVEEEKKLIDFNLDSLKNMFGIK